MSVSKEQYIDLEEKYHKVLKLLDDTSSDPPAHPFSSKYLAAEILHDMRTILEAISTNNKTPDEEIIRIKAMLGTVYLYLGIVSIVTEDWSDGEVYLQKCHEMVYQYYCAPETVLTSMNMYNQFGIFWSQRDQNMSRHYLEKAERLYKKFKALSIPPLDVADLFHSSLEEANAALAFKNFEKLYTFTLYYLAQIHGALKNTLRSSIYCHITLQRQLEDNDYDPIDWALNAATLSQVFMERNGFKQARHHLAASSTILHSYEEKLNGIEERNEEYDAKMEVFKHRSADVARCWAKYGILLLAKSKERLMNHTDTDKKCSMTSDLRDVSLETEAHVKAEDLENLDFSLDVTEFERQVTDDFVLTIQDARPVFLNIQEWLRKAESYYTLDSMASDHIEIVQDYSQMYLNLLFFEDCMDNQAKLHKRRIDLLENVLKKINPRYYLQYCRQMWFDLGQTYFELLNIKSDKLRESEERPSAHMLTKINSLAEKSIYNFECFIESFRQSAGKEFPKRIAEESEKVFLQAFFHIAALHSKFITLDKQAQFDNTESSYKAYKMIFNYCNMNEGANLHIPMEYNICKEMVELLPVKMEKMKQEIGETAQ